MNLSRSSGRAVMLRLMLLIAVLLLATWGAHMVREALHLEIRPGNEQQVHHAIMLGTVANIGLLALPFVPGAEIGLAMLAAFGPGFAPLIYVATVASMTLAYTAGRFLPVGALERLLSLLRMRRAADLVARAAPLSREDRLTMLLDGQPKRALTLGLRYRYIALALAVNSPGNSIIGGGGGIMMMAGLNGIFSPLATFLTVALTVSPVPLAVMFLRRRIYSARQRAGRQLTLDRPTKNADGECLIKGPNDAPTYRTGHFQTGSLGRPDPRVAHRRDRHVRDERRSPFVFPWREYRQRTEPP
ncbi:hypothetical protein ACRDNQ_07290 [Palleronia sp. KMU-117]|uniref:hypothetical protein n=1 Tax=Palleronia sp. KMU-117 TaxID=3434108 RepID=UPI003D7204DC